MGKKKPAIVEPERKSRKRIFEPDISLIHRSKPGSSAPASVHQLVSSPAPRKLTPRNIKRTINSPGNEYFFDDYVASTRV